MIVKGEEQTLPAEEESPSNIKTISSKEDVVEAWESFEWRIPGDYSNKETLKRAFSTLEKDFPDFFSTISIDDLIEDVGNKRKKVLKVYRDLFPEEKKDEPFYHNINEKEEWSDHVGMVMATASRLFTGMLRMQKRINGGEDVGEDVKNYYSEKFGEKWLSKKFTIEDLKKLMSLITVHEAGEWWSKRYWEPVLEIQRKRVQEWQQGKRTGEGIEKISTLADQYKTYHEGDFLERKAKTKELSEKIAAIVREDGVLVSYGENDSTEFTVYLDGGERNDLDFILPENYEINSDLKPLVEIFKAADFLQVGCLDYATLVKLNLEESSEPKLRLNGSIALITEFTKFRPDALAAYDWKTTDSATVSDYFMDSFLVRHSLNEAILNLLFASQDFYTMGEYLDIFHKIIEGVDPNLDKNTTMVLVWRELLSNLFSRPKSPPSE